MDYQFSFKELYDVFLKTTYPIEIGGKQFVAGEIIAEFDKITIASFAERTNFVTAHGGYHDVDRVYWYDDKELNLNFSQGIFSKQQFSLLTNAKLLNCNNSTIYIPKRIRLESDENRIVTLPEPLYTPVFMYDELTGDKIEVEIQEDDTFEAPQAFTTYVIDYYSKYDGGSMVSFIGDRLLKGYFTLEGKTRVKDDITGQTKTGIIVIPRLRLMSDLSMRLGNDANPVVGTFRAVASPIGERGEQHVMEIFFLNDDIDSDI